MQRVACFAHYDKNNMIQDYLVYYLKELKKVADKIIFVSDSKVKEEELSKITPYIDKAIVEKHGEYDFGSYKRGYNYARENGLLNACEELIFINDSCYAPIFPFEEMFDKMSKRELDFWGNTENEEIMPHVQSYFVVFKPHVFNSEAFNNFMKTITSETSKDDIIRKYEVGLSKALLDAGFKYDVYCETSKNELCAFVYSHRKLVKKDRSPFMKRSFILHRVNDYYPAIKFLLKLNTHYNFEFIKSDKIYNAEQITFMKMMGYYHAFLRKQRRKVIKLRLSAKEKSMELFGKTIFDIKLTDEK